jgi:hypothetical protein
VAAIPNTNDTLARIKKKVKKNPQQVALAAQMAAQARGKMRAPGQLKKAVGAQSARQFTPAGPHKNLPMVPKSVASPALNPAHQLQKPGSGVINLGQSTAAAAKAGPLAGNRSAGAARKYGFDMNKVVEAAKRKSKTSNDIKRRT